MRRFISFFSLRKIFKWSVYLSVLSAISILICNSWINRNTSKQLYSDLSKIPSNKVGLLLGAKPGNLFYKRRIEAATELFKAGKVRFIIVSGDNHTKEYDEGTAMMNDLIAAGVPDSCISIDYAGFRTLDSVERCYKIFGQKKFTIISQEFHNQRALFIANKRGYDCVAFNAGNVGKKNSSSTYFREYFARVKCVLDIYVLGTKPKFLGDPVKINV
ncbi:MAG: vancomycin high temperature exclusion protein [Cytophagaceae bacterium]